MHKGGSFTGSYPLQQAARPNKHAVTLDHGAAQTRDQGESNSRRLGHNKAYFHYTIAPHGKRRLQPLGHNSAYTLMTNAPAQ